MSESGRLFEKVGETIKAHAGVVRGFIQNKTIKDLYICLQACAQSDPRKLIVSNIAKKKVKTKGENKCIINGVPQGSILRPTFSFFSFFDSLLADDIVIYCLVLVWTR